MSCYVCEDDHINYLVHAARQYKATIDINGEPVDLWDDTACQQLAIQLLAENVRSFEHRYPDDKGEAGVDLVTGAPAPIVWTYNLFCRLTPVQVLKSIRCYEYQSCEHPGWEASEAYANVQRIKNATICALPGFEAAIWGAPEMPSAGNVRRIA